MATPSAAAAKPCCVCAAPGGKHCTKCKSRHYCGKACQLVDWNERGHKAQCKQMASKFQDRLLDELMPAKLKIKEEPAIVEDVALAADFKASARLSAVRATAIKGDADDAPDWRGTCAICLDLLPIEEGKVTFYDCCCKKICTACNIKCRQRDHRCPLCRAPASKSMAEVVRRLQKHVDKGNAEAQVQLGNLYNDGDMGLKNNFKRAFQLYELSAAQGHATGEFRLGFAYEAGQGVDIDSKTAALWYRRAAEQGYSNAQSNLGYMFYNGKPEGVAQSYDGAVKLFRLAAAQGNAYALYMLGACYASGHGVPRDEALRLFKRAAAGGYAGAAAVIEQLEEALAQAPCRRRR